MSIAKVSILFLAAVLLISGLAPSADAGDRAVIVGVNTYPHLDDADLRAARGDAVAFKDFVINSMGFRPDQITLLLDRDATRKNVFDAIITKLLRETRPGDRAVFYFSGHGTQFPDRDGEEEDSKDEVIILSDAGSKQSAGVIVDDDLRFLLGKIPDRQIMVVVDSCHSGTITRSAGEDGAALVRQLELSPEDLAPLDAMPELPELAREAPVYSFARTTVPAQQNMSVWTAVGQHQVALEIKTGGIFTRNFIDGLGKGYADRNRNGTVSNAELLAYVRQNSQAFCNKSRLCAQKNQGRLTPEFSGSIDAAALITARPEPDLSLPTPTPPADPVSEQPPIVIPEAPDQGTSPSAQLTNDAVTPSTDAPANGSTVEIEEPQEPPEVLPTKLNREDLLKDLFVDQNAANLQVDLTPGERLLLGDSVRFDVTADQDGDLILFDYNPKGELFQIFPSRLSSSSASAFRAASGLSLPEAKSASGKPLRIRVTEPTGRGHLIAILVNDDIREVTDILPAHVNLRPIDNARRHLVRIADHLMRTQIDEAGARASNWSSVVIPYTISN